MHATIIVTDDLLRHQGEAPDEDRYVNSLHSNG